MFTLYHSLLYLYLGEKIRSRELSKEDLDDAFPETNHIKKADVQ